MNDDTPTATAADTGKSTCPSMWSISYATLMELEETASLQFGVEKYAQMTMRDLNREIIEQRCRASGTSFALSVNPNGLKVDAFITHSWDGVFCDFVESIRNVFQTSVVKPNLWICAFALIQGDHQLVEQQVGGKDTSLQSSPFVKALEQASQFVVVRNSNTDLYSRIWCVCELLFAKARGLVPQKTYVTGPDNFGQLETSVLDAQSTQPEDKAKILKFLLNEHQYQEIDHIVHLFRTQEAPKYNQLNLRSIVPSGQKDDSLRKLRSILHPLCEEDKQLMQEQLGKFAQGTRQWVIRGFDEWLGNTVKQQGDNNNSGSANSRIFVLTAIAGVGKTGIMCKLAKDRSHHVVASHFCRHDDNRRNNPKRMLLSLAYQLAQKFPLYKAQLEGMVDEGTLKEEAIDKYNLNSLFNELLKIPLAKLNVDSTEKHVMLIDALDECETKGKNNILLCIQRHFLRLPPWLYVYITSRPEVPVMEKLKRFCPKLLEPTEAENQADLTIFYEQVLKQASDKLSSCFDVDRAIQTLVKKSSGLFVYASFLADMIRSSEDNSVTQDVVDRFPDDLDGYYEEQFDRICSSDSECLEWKIVKLVTCAAEPLHVETIQWFLKCKQKDLMNSVKTVSQFFQVDEHWKLHIYHKSLVDFLTSDDRVYSDLYIDKEEQENLFAAACLDVLRNLFPSDVQMTTGTQSYHAEVISYVLTYGVMHLCSAGMHKEAKGIIFNVEWLMTRAKLGDFIGIVADCRLAGKADKAVELLGRAVGLSMNALRVDYRHLPGQLIGRLGGPNASWSFAKEGGDTASFDLHEFLTRLEQFNYGFDWFCPLSAAWDQACEPCMLVLRGHNMLVNQVVFSPSGCQVASASRDATLRLWDLESGALEQLLRGHRGEVICVDYSPDGNRLVSGGADKKLIIWDSDTGAWEEVIKQTGRVVSVEWSRFGIVSGATSKISIWNADTAPAVCRTAINMSGISKVKISPDGKRVIVVSKDDFIIRVFGIASGLCEQEIDGHTNIVRSISLSTDGRYFVSASSDNSVRLFDLNTFECLAIYEDHSNSVFDVAFSPDSKKLVSGSYDNVVRVFDIGTDRCESTFRGHANSVISVAFCPTNNTLLVTGSVDKSIRVWNTLVSSREKAGGDPVQSSDFVTSIAWSPSGDTCFVGSRHKKIRFFNPATGVCTKVIQTADEINKLAWSPLGIVAASRLTNSELFDIETGALILRYEGHTDCVNDVAYMDNTVVSGSRDCTVRVFDADTGVCRLTLLGHEASVETVAFSPYGTKIASGSNDKTVRIYNLVTGSCERVMDFGISFRGNYDLRFSQDGKEIFSRTQTKAVCKWAIASATCTLIARQKTYSYPPKGFDVFAPNRGIEEKQEELVSPQGKPVAIRGSRVYFYGRSNPCAISRGSVVFFKLMPGKDGTNS